MTKVNQSKTFLAIFLEKSYSSITNKQLAKNCAAQTKLNTSYCFTVIIVIDAFDQYEIAK